MMAHHGRSQSMSNSAIFHGPINIKPVVDAVVSVSTEASERRKDQNTKLTQNKTSVQTKERDCASLPDIPRRTRAGTRLDA